MIAGLCITVWAIANIVALALCKAAAQSDEMPIEIGVSGSKSAGIADGAFPLDPPPPQPRAIEAARKTPGIPAPMPISTNIEHVETLQGFWYALHEVAAAARALPLEDPNIDADARRLLCWEHYCETG